MVRTPGHNSHGPEVFTCLLYFGGKGTYCLCHFVVVIGWFVCLVFFFWKYKEIRKKKVFPRFYKKQSSREKSVMAVYLSTGIGSELQKESFFSLRFDFIHEKKNP